MSDESINRLREALYKLLHPRVLVVEDDPNDAFFAKRALQEIGAEVKVVDTAGAAVQALHDSAFGLCLLDLKLPDSDDPIDLVRRIKKAQPLIQIAILTGSLHDDTLRQALENQVLGVVLKPLTTEQLKGAFTE